MAVHVVGQLGTKRLPVVCIAGFHRNMCDFSEFAPYLSRLLGNDWPVVLLDLRGRGRSTRRRQKKDYATPADAIDVSAIADALGIRRCVFVGQGYGGQVAMALAAQRPTLIGGAVLIDSGPVSDPRGLVRLRNNLRHIGELRGQGALKAAFRHMLLADYPGTPEAELHRLALRTHAIGKRGRAEPLFDPHLIKLLESFEHDDVLVPQWQYFEALAAAPLLMLRTQLTDQLRREIFDEMMRRRPDASAFVIEGQGSPALLDQPEEVEAIASFVRGLK